MLYLVGKTSNSKFIMNGAYVFETEEGAMTDAALRAAEGVDTWFVFAVERPKLLKSYKTVSRVEEVDLSQQG